MVSFLSIELGRSLGDFAKTVNFPHEQTLEDTDKGTCDGYCTEYIGRAYVQHPCGRDPNSRRICLGLGHGTMLDLPQLILLRCSGGCRCVADWFGCFPEQHISPNLGGVHVRLSTDSHGWTSIEFMVVLREAQFKQACFRRCCCRVLTHVALVL
ncbi:hypothetical protein BO86DRAFT_177150 [Aspergillus japonicus CBS 114.51]|uniref:Uncharacterized protein n=1 Tax=Aspergillus japonicus CBS 114.51 TaxID=1448312 RepID=A0A8T8WSE5_ASPJA|nr:hypothetical protein BO86DRAFT_177150 [Aspergillus japonicus CBS 114.51]RAH78633.1 hypothetical protein BO86DRAFT_177150 [Aspergillus japonicus CBS 114.51]